MNFEAVERLIRFGFRVFPLQQGGKLPATDEFAAQATSSLEKARRWWYCPVFGSFQGYNVGIYTGGLVVVDVDNKDGKDGDGSLIELELQGLYLPDTFTQTTPTGGKHLVYRASRPISNSVSRLGPGLDIRAAGGYIVGAGSTIGGVPYTANWKAIASAPAWLEQRLGEPFAKVLVPIPSEIDAARARERAVRYLELAPVAIQGSGGNEQTYKVAAQLKDEGVSAEEATALLLEHWNDRCQPPWDPAELEQIVANAYQYGKKPVGAEAPEVVFDPLPLPPTTKADPIDELNREYAFIVVGGAHHILREHTDAKGKPAVSHMHEQTFHRLFAAKKIHIGDGKHELLTKLWISSPKRRTYPNGFCFLPGKEAAPGYYNLFRGWGMEPAAPGEEFPEDQVRAVDTFFEHALQNVCQGDKLLFEYLIGFFAHLVQKPWEKPLVSLVFRGKKGVGKNALVDRVGALLGNHYTVAADSRYLTGNFNSHLENCLMFTLDEAFWSGEKRAESKLKDLITGQEHLIEHKGREPFKVDNLTRVVIIGNEDWLVPATEDERRYAVFDVGTGRQRDTRYFHDMRVGMEAGGYRLLLRRLLDWKITVDLNHAPDTEGLVAQKIESLGPVERWWMDCLADGEILGAMFDGKWPKELPTNGIYDAFTSYAKKRNIRSWLPSQSAFGRRVAKMGGLVKHRVRGDGGRAYVYAVPSLSEARRNWEQFLGHRIKWSNDDDD